MRHKRLDAQVEHLGLIGAALLGAPGGVYSMERWNREIKFAYTPAPIIASTPRPEFLDTNIDLNVIILATLASVECGLSGSDTDQRFFITSPSYPRAGPDTRTISWLAADERGALTWQGMHQPSSWNTETPMPRYGRSVPRVFPHLTVYLREDQVIERGRQVGSRRTGGVGFERV